MAPDETIVRAKVAGALPDVALPDLGRTSVAAEFAEDNANRLSFGCGVPDEGDAEIADSDADALSQFLAMPNEYSPGYCEHLIAMHASQVAFAKSGRGGVPIDCRPTVPGAIAGRHVVTYWVDRASFGRFHTRTVTERELRQIDAARVWRWSLDELLTWKGQTVLDVALRLMREAFRLWGVQFIEVDDGHDGSVHMVHIKSQVIAGGTIGFAYFLGTVCGHVLCVIDSSWDGGLMGLSRLLTHECGHCVNLRHEPNGRTSDPQNRSVMSYTPPASGLFYGFHDGGELVDLPADRSLPELREWYGGEAVPIIGEPQPPEPQPPAGLLHRSSFKDTAGNSLSVSINRDTGNRPPGGIIW